MGAGSEPVVRALRALQRSKAAKTATERNVERAIKQRLGRPRKPKKIRTRKAEWWAEIGRLRPRHIFIPDTQVKAGVEINHIACEGEYVAYKKPDVIIIAGDWWDYPGISFYDKNMADYYVGDVLGDFCSGLHALDVFLSPIYEAMGHGWEPTIVMLEGNHEYRMWRDILRDRRNLKGIPLPEVVCAKYGIKFFTYQQVVDIDGVLYSHVMVNPNTGRPWGGTASYRLGKVKASFTMGHQQRFDLSMDIRPDGSRVRGLVAGANYQHYEKYLGPQGNNHWRGIVVKNDLDGRGDYDVTEVRLRYLLNRYKPPSLKADGLWRADEFSKWTLAGA